MEHQEKPILAVVAGLIHRETQLLLCQRPAHKARPLKWEFPGGKIESGETPQEALIRECREELGIEIRPLESVTQLQWQYDDVTVSLSLWEAVIAEGEPQLLEHQALQWLPLEELDNLPLCPADEKMLPDIRKWWSRRFSDTVLYDKLVRDEIPRIIQQDGNQCIYDVLSPAEYLRRLDEKLQEEVTEYRESGKLEELADIGEVLLAILEYRGISRQAYEQAILQKRRERGGFSKRLLLREVRTPRKHSPPKKEAAMPNTTLQIIAHIHNDFPTKFGLPRQSGLVGELKSTLIFEPEYRVWEAFRGLEEYSHIWLIWQFSQAIRENWSPTVRPPRLGGNRRMGVFATRSPFRPNGLGLSSVRLEKVEKDPVLGPVLHLAGADLMDGTPIFDIKPYLPFTDSHPDAAAGFAGAVQDYHLEVEIPERWQRLIPASQQEALRAVLAQDPRPAYQEDPERIYGFLFGDKEIRFAVREGVLTVVEIQSAFSE